MSVYRSITAPAEGLYKEMGSRFMAYAYPVADEEEVKKYLFLLKKEHAKASHVCYAYILGTEKTISKYSDDGEPHHSAGTPILGQIRSYGLTNVLVAVVRYFGGTKLGVSGLTAAYKQAAALALSPAVIIEKNETEELIFETDYTNLPRVMNFVKQNGIKVLSQMLNTNCIFTLQIPKENAERLKMELEELKI